MNSSKPFSFSLSMLIVVIGFSQCSSAQKLQDKAPLEIGQIYCQKWIAGIQGGGSGINIFIQTGNSSIKLDSVYFRGKVAKLESTPQEGILYIGRFKSIFNQKQDLIMSSDPNAEYGNELPKIPKKIPFELKDNECVISYKQGDKTKYFKLDKIVEKEMLAYPSAPPNKQ